MDVRSGPLLAQAEVFFVEPDDVRSGSDGYIARSSVQGVRHPVRARGELRLRPVLRAARGRLRLQRGRAGRGQAKDPGRAGGHLALRGLPALRRAPARPAPAGPDAARTRRPARRAPRPGRGLGQERRRQSRPTRSRTGWSPLRSPRRRSSASTPSPAPRPATLPTRSPPTPPPPAWTPTCSCPADLEEQKLLATGVYGTRLVGVKGNYDDVNRLCTQLADERPWAFVNVNLRPYYAEGSKTIAYETVEQLGWALPDRVVCPIASGSLFTKIGLGFAEWIELGLVGGRAADVQRRTGRGLQPGRRGVRGRLGGLQAPAARRRSPRAWRSATRPTGPMRSSSRAARAGP